MLETLNSDYLRTARAKGISRAAGDRAPRVPQRADPARDLRGASTSGRSSAASSSPSRSSSIQGMGCTSSTPSSNGDYPQILPWMMIVVFFVIVFNLLADLRTRGSTRGSALTDLQPNRARTQPAACRRRRPRSTSLDEATDAGRAGRRQAALAGAARMAPVPPAQARDGEHGRPASSSRSAHRSSPTYHARHEDPRQRRRGRSFQRPNARALVRHRTTIGRDMCADVLYGGRISLEVGARGRVRRRRSSARSSARSPASTAVGSTTS